MKSAMITPDVLRFTAVSVLLVVASSVPAYCQNTEDVAIPIIGVGIPTWTASFTYQGTSYRHTMVGTNPSQSGTHNTTISVLMIPLIMKFSDGTIFDPTVANSMGFAPVQKVLFSPLFLSAPFKAGNVNLGTTQYMDAFQRANFWNHIDATHDFHIRLSNPPPVIYHQLETVSAANGYTSTDANGNKQGHVDWAFLNPLTQQLLQTYSSPNQLTIFLLYNVSIYNVGNRGPSHTAGGYHNVYTTLAGATTFIVVDFTDAKDVSPLSHELGEWLDDPFVNNKVPGWSGGQVSGCSKLLEVGDPLSGIRFTVTLNGETFHLQDLTFLSWFARRSPSTSVNQWYSFRNNLPAPPPVCQ